MPRKIEITIEKRKKDRRSKKTESWVEMIKKTTSNVLGTALSGFLFFLSFSAFSPKALYSSHRPFSFCQKSLPPFSPSPASSPGFLLWNSLPSPPAAIYFLANRILPLSKAYRKISLKKAMETSLLLWKKNTFFADTLLLSQKKASMQLAAKKPQQKRTPLSEDPPRCQPFIGSFNSTTWFTESQLRGDTWFLEIVTPVQS